MCFLEQMIYIFSTGIYIVCILWSMLIGTSNRKYVTIIILISMFAHDDNTYLEQKTW